MIIDDQHYDVIIIGSGAAGGTLAGSLAGTRQNVLILERGGPMPLADQNVADVELLRSKDRYPPQEKTLVRTRRRSLCAANDVCTWRATPRSGARCWSACAKQDFSEVVPLQEGIAAMGADYGDTRAVLRQGRELYQVHGKAGVDPTASPSAAQSDFSAAPKPVEPFLAEPLQFRLQRQGCSAL